MIGYQVFVLHAHLPYVRHKGYEPQFIEENWLNEAIAETYIPLLQSFRNLKNEKCTFQNYDVLYTYTGHNAQR